MVEEVFLERDMKSLDNGVLPWSSECHFFMFVLPRFIPSGTSFLLLLFMSVMNCLFSVELGATFPCQSDLWKNRHSETRRELEDLLASNYTDGIHGG